MSPIDLSSRRAFLGQFAGAVGSMALADLLRADEPQRADPLGSKVPHHPPRAHSIICLFQHGGPSQMDLFDPKPELTRHHGRPHPGQVEVSSPKAMGNLLASPFRFRNHGQSGIELSDLLPHTGRIVDDITLVRSMETFDLDHAPATRIFNTGKRFLGRPGMGAWVIYGLGSMRSDLPAYVVLLDPQGLPLHGNSNWSSGFLPAIYQGTPFRARGAPVANLTVPTNLPAEARQNELAFLDKLNLIHRGRNLPNPELEARLRNYELAAQMQTAVPPLLDISKETAETRRLYGLDNPVSGEYGRRCLMARRLVEQGVRFVQVFHSGNPWDTHSQNSEKVRELCAKTDQGSAALVLDLKRRGLLDSTIVLWTGEFGRSPTSQGPDGRDHNRRAFSLWLAGGGFKQGYVHGATDEFSYQSIKDVVRVYDLQATLLHALGLDHLKLTFPHEGRNDSLTDSDLTKAQVIPNLLA
jgi:hypothetical protein